MRPPPSRCLSHARYALLLLCLLPALAPADDDSRPLGGNSVEDNIRALDANHDGQVSMSEIRAYLEAKYGKGYRQALLEEMQTKAEASCGTPFSRSFY